MPTDFSGETEIRVDNLKSQEDLLQEVAVYEAENLKVVNVTASFESLGKLSSMMLALRASNISPLLLVEAPVELPSREEVRSVILKLRDWDQLVLQNVLKLCTPFIPQEYLGLLDKEARIELKWFKEWIGASQDPRLANSGLPWRSFIRKTVGENFDFANRVLDEGVEHELGALVSSFLEQKKQAVCLFPKRWRRQNESTH